MVKKFHYLISIKSLLRLLFYPMWFLFARSRTLRSFSDNARG